MICVYGLNMVMAGDMTNTVRIDCPHDNVPDLPDADVQRMPIVHQQQIGASWIHLIG